MAEPAAALFYARLFALDPSLRTLFKGDMVEQGRKLMTMLALVVSKLDQLDRLLPAVQALGERHAQYGVQPSDYETVAEALLWTLGQGLDEAYTPEVEAAWTAAYTTLAAAMQPTPAAQPVFA
jgi:hemoglobin-like flavoprotein